MIFSHILRELRVSAVNPEFPRPDRLAERQPPCVAATPAILITLLALYKAVLLMMNRFRTMSWEVIAFTVLLFWTSHRAVDQIVRHSAPADLGKRLMDHSWGQVWAYEIAAQIVVWLWVALLSAEMFQELAPLRKDQRWPLTLFLAAVFFGMFGYFLYYMIYSSPDSYAPNQVIVWIKYPSAILRCLACLMPAAVLWRLNAQALRTPTADEIVALHRYARRAMLCLSLIIALATLSYAAILKADRAITVTTIPVATLANQPWPEFYQYVLVYGVYYTAMLGMMYIPAAISLQEAGVNLVKTLTANTNPEDFQLSSDPAGAPVGRQSVAISTARIA